MLEQVRVKNFALIEDLTLEFHPKLNVLTGETGAGKTLLIEALSAVLGGRLDQSLVRRNKEEQCLIEATFDVRSAAFRKRPECDSWLSNADEALILRREITSDGRNKCSINGRSANVSQLKEIGAHLMDFYGQFDHQLLMNAASHIDTLDRLGGLAPLIEKYRAVYDVYAALQQQKAELETLKDGRARELDLLKFQIDELERARPEPDEDLKLKEEHIRLANAERLAGRAGEVTARLIESDHSATDQIGACVKALTDLTKIDASVKPLLDQLTDAELILGEVARAISDYKDRLTFDPERLREVELRMDALALVKKSTAAHSTKRCVFWTKPAVAMISLQTPTSAVRSLM